MKKIIKKIIRKTNSFLNRCLPNTKRNFVILISKSTKLNKKLCSILEIEPPKMPPIYQGFFRSIFRDVKRAIKGVLRRLLQFVLQKPLLRRFGSKLMRYFPRIKRRLQVLSLGNLSQQKIIPENNVPADEDFSFFTRILVKRIENSLMFSMKDRSN